MFVTASKAVLATAAAALLLPGPAVSADADATDRSVLSECDVIAGEPPRRRRPGGAAPEPWYCDDRGLAPAVWRAMPEFVAIPDRWRIVSAVGYPERLWDPYNGNNVLKGDRPAFGDDWFVSLNAVSDSTYEYREIPTPVGGATTEDPGSLDILGNIEQRVFNQNLIIEAVLYRGDTVFRPPDYELRFIPVFNFNDVRVEERGVLKADPGSGTTRSEGFVGIQGLFLDKHLRNVSERFDFDSIRIGIQPITADFRGFLYQDNPIGVRLFGTRNNNLWQYNIAWFRRIEKDTNSGLNDITEQSFSDGIRDDDVFLFSLYRQDFPWLGFTSQFTLVHNRNREAGEIFYDDNGFIVRPASLGSELIRDYDVTYIGLNGDGHIGRWNLSASAYFAYGDESLSTFTGRDSDIRAFFFAAELSRDYDWMRFRGTVIYASGDDDPFDDVATGYDAILENPLIAGADTSFWIRQAVPLIGGGRVTLSGQNGLLNSMRSSKGQGQSNFTNPGLGLIGFGADLDITPKIRLSMNLNQLWFSETAVLEAARNQGGMPGNIGQDASVSLIYRPLNSQNIVFRASAAALFPGNAYKRLFGSGTQYSVQANLILSY